MTCTFKNKTLEGAPVQGIRPGLDHAVDAKRSMCNYNYYHYVQLLLSLLLQTILIFSDLHLISTIVLFKRVAKRKLILKV